MTYQLRGMQVSLLLHATAIMLMWGINGSLAESGKAVVSLDFNILRGSNPPAHTTAQQSSLERTSQEVPPPVKEREASLDGKVIASIADAQPTPRQQPESNTNSREGRTTDVEFGSTTGPFYHRQVTPWYPTIARKMGKEGRVLLRLTIDEHGKLINVEVLEDPGYGFAEEAVKAVKQSSYVPARRAGIPVLTTALLPIRFVLKN